MTEGSKLTSALLNIDTGAPNVFGVRAAGVILAVPRGPVPVKRTTHLLVYSTGDPR